MKQNYQNDNEFDFLKFLTAGVGITVGAIIGFAMAGFFEKNISVEEYQKQQDAKKQEQIAKQEKMKIFKNIFINEK